jgi:hypothetical protein
MNRVGQNPNCAAVCGVYNTRVGVAEGDVGVAVSDTIRRDKEPQSFFYNCQGVRELIVEFWSLRNPSGGLGQVRTEYFMFFTDLGLDFGMLRQKVVRVHDCNRGRVVSDEQE